VSNTEKSGRANQRLRTRKELLLAAARLMQQGRQPSLDEVAQAALISRATAYRYFINAEALLSEAALHIGSPEPEELFRDDPSTDPVARLERVDTVLHDLILANEPQMRIMLSHSVKRPLEGETAVPPRQNRRSPLIDAALAPARERFEPAALGTLAKALALLIGTEGIVAAKDVLQLDDDDARAVKRWAIRALVAAAQKPD